MGPQYLGPSGGVVHTDGVVGPRALSGGPCGHQRVCAGDAGCDAVGVALVGAAIGATVVNVAFSALQRGEPGLWVVVLAAVAGAVVAVYLQRYVIIVGTGFLGAWTILVGGMALVGDRAAMAAAVAGDAWVIYPLDPAPGRMWVPIVWVVGGLIGTAVQMGFTGGDKGRVGSRKK